MGRVVRLPDRAVRSSEALSKQERKKSKQTGKGTVPFSHGSPPATETRGTLGSR